MNFTKASCTLDASVKIYSYRVDDVHLSSYRVLANLNRTDSNKGNAATEEGEVEEVPEGEVGVKSVSKKKNPERKGSVETLETNLGESVLILFAKCCIDFVLSQRFHLHYSQHKHV